MSTLVIKQIISDPYNYANKISIKQLERTIKIITQIYYNTNKNVIPDNIYDMLKDILKKRDPNSKILKQVGAPISRDKIALPYYTGSLEKIKPDTKALETFIKQYIGPYVLSDKLDGSSGIFYVENAEKQQYKLFTRGDGTMGKNISQLIPYVIKNKLNIKELSDGMAIRGELIISKQNFAKLCDIMKKRGEEPFENLRSVVNGVVNTKYVNKEIAELTEFITHSVMFPRMKHTDQMIKLKKINFSIVEYKIEKEITNDKLTEWLVKRRKESPYEVDGIVVIDSSKIYQIEKDKDPKEGFAFKAILTDQKAETTVLDIIWEVSKNGYIIPTIKIEPVVINGVTIKSITGNNGNYIEENVLGPGAIVEVIRSGDVIPKILRIIQKASSGKPKFPDISYKWNDSHVHLVVQDIFGAQKDQIAIKQIVHFFEKINVKYISDGIVKKLVDGGYKSIIDIIVAKPEELEKINGIGDKLIKKIYANIQNSLQTIDLATLMASSNISGKGLGVRKLKLIIEKYPDIMTVKWSKEEMIKKIIEVDGFSDKTSTVFADNFPLFKIWFAQLEKVVNIKHLTQIKKQNVDVNKKKIFDGQIFVFTGERNKALMKFVEDNGGKLGNSVSSKTTYLIYSAKSPDTSTSKFTDAKKHTSCTIITDIDFIKKFKISI